MTKPFNEDSLLAAQALEEQQHSEGAYCGADAPGCRCENKTLATALESGRLALVEVALIERLVETLQRLRHGKDGCFCEVAIDNPMIGGRHSSYCPLAEEAVAVAMAAGFGGAK